VDGEDERQRAMETGCSGDQGSPRAVAPRGRNYLLLKEQNDFTVLHVSTSLDPTL
jgi:hypothetical protein